MLIISSNFVLAPDAYDPRGPDNPLIGWQNLVTRDNITATSATVAHPASELANEMTNLRWEAENTATQYLTVALGAPAYVDYIGIATHNFATAESIVTVEGYISGSWVPLVGPQIFGDNSPFMMVFSKVPLSLIRIKIEGSIIAPTAAVLYVGALLVMERAIYVGFVPPSKAARKTEASNGKAERGQFLGRIVMSESRETTVPFSLISPAFFWEVFMPALDAYADLPFFIAWRPQTYPKHVGYFILDENPKPVNEAPTNRVSFNLKMSGVV